MQKLKMSPDICRDSIISKGRPVIRFVKILHSIFLINFVPLLGNAYAELVNQYRELIDSE